MWCKILQDIYIVCLISLQTPSPAGHDGGANSFQNFSSIHLPTTSVSRCKYGALSRGREYRLTSHEAYNTLYGGFLMRLFPSGAASYGMQCNESRMVSSLLPPISSPPQPDDVPIGFHMKLGHNITIATNREVQLGNYSVVSHNLILQVKVLHLSLPLFLCS